MSGAEQHVRSLALLFTDVEGAIRDREHNMVALGGKVGTRQYVGYGREVGRGRNTYGIYGRGVIQNRELHIAQLAFMGAPDASGFRSNLAELELSVDVDEPLVVRGWDRTTDTEAPHRSFATLAEPLGDWAVARAAEITALGAPRASVPIAAPSAENIETIRRFFYEGANHELWVPSG